MAAAATLTHTPSVEELETLWALSEVKVVPELAIEQESRERAERLIRMAGSSALSTEVGAEQAQPYTLHEALKWAECGVDEYLMVKINVATDVMERTFKAGHVMKTPVSVDAFRRLGQYGQTFEDIQLNALHHASRGWQMRERTEAETRNSMRLQAAHRAGLLKDHFFVVLSRAADNMTEKELDDAGFFSETMSCAIQATGITDRGLEVQSAFVAGVKTPGQARHDAETIVKMVWELGVDFRGKTAAEIIDTPLLVPKSIMPNGVIDLVPRFDSAAGGTFFGEDKPKQGYLEYLEVCRKRERNFELVIEKITNQLISEADSINSPLAATERLHQLSQQYTVERAVTDTSINPRVFGLVAAGHIEQARLYAELGDAEQAQRAVNMAQKTAKSNSCPTGARTTDSDTVSSKGEKENKNDKTDEDEFGSLKFNCPKKGCLNTRPRGKLIKNCQKCGADVTCK